MYKNLVYFFDGIYLNVWINGGNGEDQYLEDEIQLKSKENRGKSLEREIGGVFQDRRYIIIDQKVEVGVFWMFFNK